MLITIGLDKITKHTQCCENYLVKCFGLHFFLSLRKIFNP